MNISLCCRSGHIYTVTNVTVSVLVGNTADLVCNVSVNQLLVALSRVAVSFKDPFIVGLLEILFLKKLSVFCVNVFLIIREQIQCCVLRYDYFISCGKIQTCLLTSRAEM